jgi:DNA-binding beta-propeller fold protein YncE
VNVLVCLGLALPAIAQSAPPAEFARLGAYVSEIVDLARPAAVAIDANDRVYVVEELAGRVRVFDSAGVPLRTFGELGGAHGDLREPQGIAVPADGKAYVADTGNDRVCVFDAEGRFERVIGRRGAGPGEFNHPLGVAVYGERLYVADSRNHRVQVFDREGTFVLHIGRCGRGRGELFHPVDVAVDSAGAVYVADLDNERIQKFDSAGKFVASIGDFGPYLGLFASPSGVRCVDDRLYVADRDNHRVQVFDAKGAVLYEWGLHVLRPREGAGKLHYPNQIAIAPSGRFAVVAESVENRCQFFGPKEQGAPAPLVQDKGASSHVGAGIDVRNELCALVEPSTPGALLLDFSTGRAIEITRFGGYGSKPGELIRPVDIAFTNDAQSVWISDPGNARLSMFKVARAPGEPLRYDPVLARFVKSIDLNRLSAESGSASAPWPIEPGTIECDASGDLYVADLANARVVVIGSDLSIRRTFGRHGTGAGELLRPTAIAFSRSNELVYVVDAAAQRVQAFDREGSASFAFGGRGDAPGEFVRPFGCTVNIDGFVYVTDEGAHVVQKFDERGRFVARFGVQGLGRIEFFEPQGIACDRSNALWIVDSGNHRVQVLPSDGSFREAIGARLYVQPTLAEPR